MNLNFFSIFLRWHARDDEVVPFLDEQIYVDQQCQHGANIQFQILHGADHETAFYEGIPGQINFLGHIFNHTTPIVKCGEGPLLGSDFVGAIASNIMPNTTISRLSKWSRSTRGRSAKQRSIPNHRHSRRTRLRL